MKHHTDKDNSEKCDKVENRIGSKERDNEIWKVIMGYYNEKNLENKRKENQKKSYWCRSEKGKNHLFSDPKQRIMARFITSFYNSPHRGKRPEEWFSESDIINTIQNFVKSKKKRDGTIKTMFTLFAKDTLVLLNDMKLKKYSFNQQQTVNFSSLRARVHSVFEERTNPTNRNNPEYLSIPGYEKFIIEKSEEPYQTIMKMQKLLPGYGTALACDFLKETHLYNIAKPDVHLCHVFSVIDKTRYSMDLALAKRIAEFAEHVSSPDSNNFCNSGSFYIDKIIWMLCSESKSIKKKLMEKIAEI